MSEMHGETTEPEAVPDTGFYGDGPQQGTLEAADDRDGLYGDGPGQGVETSGSELGDFHSDSPLGEDPYG
ncbi:hypothetical protein WDV85_13985 [Pseudokineococcus sp. 5B2Z-1]|uniref:hypothetical protein n=1 Tax=Pseudokineococcus sp. 5B2Z-1 TaxID=3132744 RepID=UPI002614174B|nr:hypothetical protein [uncultured Pseudokineococcus sp.]